MAATCTRREVLWIAGALAATGSARVAHAGGTGAGPVRASPPELAPGLRLGPCTLTRVLPVEAGALPVEIEDASGRRALVEVHRHDARAPGLARAGSLAVYLRNGGTGSTPTHEAHGLGAMALASVLEAREQAGLPVPRLTSIVDRWQREPPPHRR